MSEPYLTTRDMVERIEGRMNLLQEDVHKIQLTLASSSATAISETTEAAIGRAKAAIWVAAGSSIAALAAVVVAIVKH